MIGVSGPGAVPRKPTMSIRPTLRRRASGLVVGPGPSVGPMVGLGTGVGVPDGEDDGGPAEDERAGAQAATSQAATAPAPARNRRRETTPVRRSVPGSP